MQENNNKNSISSADEKPNVSIGAKLVDARNSMALSQVDVAEQINLPLRIIAALDADDYENLPETPYVRGYLRNYARVVNLDATQLIAVYNEQHSVEKPSITVASTSKKRSKVGSYDPAIVWSTAAVLTVLVGMLISWWVDDANLSETNYESFNGDIAEVVPISTKSTTADIMQSSTSEDLAVVTVEEISQPQITNEAPLESAISVEIEQAMEDESINPNLISSTNDTDVLTVTYVEKSWTEIKDADSNSLIQGLIEPGVVRNLSGKAPFHVFLGNSPGVVIEVNGQYFDHSQFSRSNRTARFEISSGTIN